MDLKKLVRPNIYGLKPYSCARDEFKGEASVFLDANENPMNYPYNRYPDPLQIELKRKIAKIKGVRVSQIMLGNGSDEAIDLIFRIFCEPGKDNVVAIEPSYGMYGVCADINNVQYISVKLEEETFELDASKLLEATNSNTKAIFLCSPNNPTANLLNREEIQKILDSFHGVVVIDEAYEDFSSQKSWLTELDKNENIIVLQTFSKAWAMASVRCGMAFASEKIISFFNKVKYPYNVNYLTQSFVNEQLNLLERKKGWVDMILKQRSYLIKGLDGLNIVKKIYPSESNFLLVSVSDAEDIYKYLTGKGIIVRNRNKVSLCLGCLRITVGTKKENDTLIEALKNYNK